MLGNFKKAFVSPCCRLEEILQNLNFTGYKTVLVVDEEEKLVGIATDWDIRTALLKGVSLTTRVSEFMNSNPTVGSPNLTSSEQRDLMVKKGVESLPILDEDRRVVDFVHLRNFVTKDNLLSPIVIMAGGSGKRLWPLTEHMPKPLLPVAERPLLGHILDHIKSQGLENIWVTTCYKSEMIEDFLKDHSPSNMQVNVIKEESPLGTAGSLKLLKKQNNMPIFIMNGDILTTLDFQGMYEWHCLHGNLLTICSRHYQFQVPYGVIETDGQRVISIQEKPSYCYNVNAGIYLIEPEALTFIPEGVHCDMTDLIDTLLENDLQVGIFPISEPWIDIGLPEDYTRVNEESYRFLPVGV